MKITLSLFIICIFSQYTYGQGRSCDIKANIISHKNGHFFKSRSTEFVTTSIINLGPDTLRNNDNYMVGYVFGGSDIFPKFRKVDRLILPGDSVVFVDTLDINYVGDIDSFNFCADVRAYNTGRDSIKLEHGVMLRNNKHCITAKHKVVTMSVLNRISGNQFQIYPNPAVADQVNIRHSKDVTKLDLHNGRGQIVMTKQVAVGTKETTFEIDNLASGIYFFRATHSNGTSQHKLVIP